MFIACKFNEIELPHINNLVYVTNNTYEVSELIQLEGKVLNALDFKIHLPTRLDYLNFLLQQSGLSEKQNFICYYILELSLVDSRMKSFS